MQFNLYIVFDMNVYMMYYWFSKGSNQRVVPRPIVEVGPWKYCPLWKQFRLPSLWKILRPKLTIALLHLNISGPGPWKLFSPWLTFLAMGQCWTKFKLVKFLVLVRETQFYKMCTEKICVTWLIKTFWQWLPKVWSFTLGNVKQHIYQWRK